jgi:YHS domain-containing protein
MSDLARFTSLVKEQIASASHEPRWESAQAEHYMDEVRVRRTHFRELASRLISDIIRPRLVVVADHFPNASPSQNDPPEHCSFWFGYSERFPASTKVEFRIEHDLRFERVEICYRVTMMPVFLKLNEQDKLPLLWSAVSDDDVALWVELRLLDFLNAYLQIDRGSDELSDEPAVDPVCGMRIDRSTASFQETYRGHPYFFCSEECQVEFARNPSAFVDVKTM